MTTKKIDRLVDKCGTAFSSWQSDIVFDQRKHGKPARHNRATVEKVRDRQEALASEIDKGPRQLGAYLRRVLGLGVGDEIDAPSFPRDRLTPAEFVKPPFELEAELGRTWQNLPPRLASQPVFWLLCHVAWIEQGCLGDSGHSVRAALMTEGSPAKDSEARTRNLLRRTGGIFVRGNVSVFSDCPMAQAWWRWHLALRVEQFAEGRIGRVEAHETLRANHPAWEELIMLSLRRITVVNHPRARAAVVGRLHRYWVSTGKLTKNQVKELTVHLARLGLRRSFEYTSLDDLMGYQP